MPSFYAAISKVSRASSVHQGMLWWPRCVIKLPGEPAWIQTYSSTPFDGVLLEGRSWGNLTLWFRAEAHEPNVEVGGLMIYGPFLVLGSSDDPGLTLEAAREAVALLRPRHSMLPEMSWALAT